MEVIKVNYVIINKKSYYTKLKFPIKKACMF